VSTIYNITLHSIMAHHQYPEVEGGGSLILAWQVKNKKVLVIGGGEVSLDHHRSIRSHGEKS
jgi:NADPH-dependent glutamate synthase beta subunit-like oxidoreductase